MIAANQELTFGAAFPLAPTGSAIDLFPWQRVVALISWEERDIAVDTNGNSFHITITNSATSPDPVSTDVSVRGNHTMTWQRTGTISDVS